MLQNTNYEILFPRHFIYQVKPSTNPLSRFKRDQILPILWMEMTSGEVPEKIRAVIYHSTFSANAIQIALRYGSLFGLILSAVMLFTGFYVRNNESPSQITYPSHPADASFQTTGTVTIEELVTINLNDANKNDIIG